MKVPGWLSGASLALLLGGCLTPQQYEEHQVEWANSYLGLSMYEFTKQTGLVPTEYRAIPGGRAFMIDGKAATPTSLGYLGAPTRQTVKPCRLVLETRQVGPQGDPQSWRISRVWSEGPCLDMINHPPL